MGGRVIHDGATPLHSTAVSQQYHVQDLALAPGNPAVPYTIYMALSLYQVI